MAAFSDPLEWTRLDVLGIVANRGIAVLPPEREQEASEWFQQEGYAVVTWECERGIAAAVNQLSTLLHWEAQFGYNMDSAIRGLDAIRDGFQSDKWPGHHVAFVVRGVEVLWRQDEPWLLGILNIASEHSLQQLALGKRFLTVLLAEPSCGALGAVVDVLRVPPLHHGPLAWKHNEDGPAT